MQDGPEPGGDRGDSRRRRQDDRFPRRTWMGGAIAFMAPAQQPVAQDEPRIAAFCDHRAVRQVFEAPAPCPLPPRVPIDTFPMQAAVHVGDARRRSEKHTSELQSLMRISYAVFCLQQKKTDNTEELANQMRR